MWPSVQALHTDFYADTARNALPEEKLRKFRFLGLCHMAFLEFFFARVWDFLLQFMWVPVARDFIQSLTSIAISLPSHAIVQFSWLSVLWKWEMSKEEDMWVCLFKSHYMPTLIYGKETWTWIKTEIGFWRIQGGWNKKQEKLEEL